MLAVQAPAEHHQQPAGHRHLHHLAEACWLCRHRQSIINSLQDTDISIRRRSLDLLFAMCNKGNVREIVAELLSYLQASLLLQAARAPSLYVGQEEAYQPERHHCWGGVLPFVRTSCAFM